MTDKTRYYQSKNTQARLHGGPYRCPSCIGVVEQLGDMYHCGHCSYTWDTKGEPITLEATP